MDVVNCKGCGRLFNAISRKRLCPACLRQLEDKFLEVKRFIEENKGANIDIVSRECGVSVKQIKEWIKEERLSLAQGCMDGITCERCGKMILTGKYCNECKTKMTNNLKSVLNDKSSSDAHKKDFRDKDRMRYLKDL